MKIDKLKRLNEVENNKLRCDVMRQEFLRKN
jgi:hypothetical protein